MIEPTASKRACALIANPTDARFTDEHVRQFQGCPTIAVTKGGRIFLAWYAGGTREPHIENFNLIVKSDDGGKTWSRPIAVIPSSRERFVHALDIQLFTAPDGRLFIFWVQNDTKPDLRNPDGSKIYPGFDVDGVIFDDFVHAMWVSVCDDPDADELIFSEPRYADKGFLRCKPLVMRTGEWLCFNYDQVSDRYGYSISSDGGATFVHGYGAKKSPRRLTRRWRTKRKTATSGCLPARRTPAVWPNPPRTTTGAPGMTRNAAGLLRRIPGLSLRGRRPGACCSSGTITRSSAGI